MSVEALFIFFLSVVNDGGTLFRRFVSQYRHSAQKSEKSIFPSSKVFLQHIISVIDTSFIFPCDILSEKTPPDLPQILKPPAKFQCVEKESPWYLSWSKIRPEVCLLFGKPRALLLCYVCTYVNLEIQDHVGLSPWVTFIKGTCVLWRSFAAHTYMG